MAAASKRDILSQLKRDELWRILDENGLAVADRRKTELVLDALIGSPEVRCGCQPPTSRKWRTYGTSGSVRSSSAALS